MPSIAIDAGPLIALFDASDRYHFQALNFIKRVNGPLVTNIAVITETVYVLDFSVAAQCDFLNWAAQALHIDQQTPQDLPRIAAIMEKYRDLPADFADASLVALCERLHISVISTIDKHFDVYRTQSGHFLRNDFFMSDE